MAFLTNDVAIAGLYVSLLGRAPDADGFTFWLQAMDNGASLETIAQAMLGAPEVGAAQPTTQTGAQFIASFYTNVLGRTPDTGGLAYWSAVLQTLGGVQSAEARATLVLQIADILSTPLTTQPSGLSDADYQRALDDRALFTNKIEFGVFFATELKSNDLAMAQAALALITSDPASIQAASNLAQGIAQPEPPVVTPGVPLLAITAADSASEITTKFAVYAGTVATVDASGMAADQLEAVSAAVNKIAVVRNLNLVLADVSDTATVNLLSKAPAGSAVANASSASAIELTALAANVAKLADNGIIGALALSSAQTAVELGNLLGIKTDDAATVAVDASGMNADQLAALNNGIGKVDSVDRLSLVLADVADAATDNLLGKAVNDSATVVASGASAAELSSLATHIAQIADGGITGSLDLSSLQSATELAALLGAKTGDTTTTVTVDATAMGADQLVAVSAGIAKVDTLANLSLTLADLPDTATEILLAKASINAVVVDATGANSATLSLLAAAIDKIAPAGITGTLALSSALTAAELTALLGSKTGDATANVTVDTSDMDIAQLDALIAGLAKIDNLVDLSHLVVAELSDASLNALLTLAPAASLTVDATGANATTLSLLAASISKIADDGITGTFTLSNALGQSDLLLLTTNQLAITATVAVDATGMDTDKLNLLATNQKIDSISGLQLALKAVSLSAVDGLLAKSDAGTATIDATDADQDKLSMLATHIGNVATGGITGTLSLTSSLSASALAALLGSQTALAATVNVDASNMSMPQLEVIGLNITHVDTLTKLPPLTLYLLSDTATATLLDKSTGDVSVIATSASKNELSLLVTHFDKIAANGITGLVTLSNDQTVEQLQVLLGAKTNSTTSLVTIDASDMSMAKLQVVAASIDKIDTLLNLPQLVLTGLTNTAISALLGQAQPESVSILVTGANNATLNVLRANFDKIAPDGIDGELTLSTLDSPANLTNWLTKASLAATVTFDAAGTVYYGEYLPVIAANVSKVDHITNLSFRLATFSAETVGAFLARSSTGSVQVDASGALTDHLTAVVANIDKVKAEGLDGFITLPSSFSAGDLSALLGKIPTSAVVTVDTSSMSMEQLEVIGSNISKIDTLTNLPQLNLGSLSDTATAALLAAAPASQPLTVLATGASNGELSTLSTYIDKINTVNGLSFSLQNVSDDTTAALLSKTPAGSARINVTGASATEVTTLLGNLDKIVDRGLSGTLQVAYASLNAGVNATLSSKMDQGSPVKVTGTSAKEVMTFPGLTTNLIIDPAGGGDFINLGSSSATILITDRASTRNSQLSVNDTTTDNLLHIESTGAVVLRYSTADNAFGDGLAFTPGVFASSYGIRSDGANRIYNTLGDVIAGANAEIGSLVRASTSADPVFYTFEIQGGDGLQGRFRFFNDHDTVLTLDDLIMTSAISSVSTIFMPF